MGEWSKLPWHSAMVQASMCLEEFLKFILGECNVDCDVPSRLIWCCVRERSKQSRKHSNSFQTICGSAMCARPRVSCRQLHANVPTVRPAYCVNVNGSIYIVHRQADPAGCASTVQTRMSFL